MAATLATLVVLPTVFAIVQANAGRESPSIDPADPGQLDEFEPAGVGGPPCPIEPDKRRHNRCLARHPLDPGPGILSVSPGNRLKG